MAVEIKIEEVFEDEEELGCQRFGNEEVRDGFGFIAINYPSNVKNAIVIRSYDRSIEEYTAYIREHNIEQAEIIMPDINFLKECPSLKHLNILPSCNAPQDFDFSPLYEMPEIKSLGCENTYGSSRQYMSKIDYARINGLIDLSVDVNKGTLNYNRVKTLKSMKVGDFKGKNRDLTDLFCSPQLDTLEMIQCGIQSLNGIETSLRMQRLSLCYNRSLSDISALSKVKGTLKDLIITSCPKIEDFSVLGELENLEALELFGSNVLPNLDFLKTMKNLKFFSFNMNVLDGDLTPCLRLPYVSSERNRKHYNLKDKELPKDSFTIEYDNIEEWRYN